MKYIKTTVASKRFLQAFIVGTLGVVVVLGNGCGRFGFTALSPGSLEDAANLGSQFPGIDNKACTTPAVPGRVGLQRLTTRQMENTLTDLVGFAVTAPQGFPRDDQAGGYVSLPETQLMSTQYVEMKMEWMLTLAGQVVTQNSKTIFSCDYTTAGATCVDKVLSDFMFRAFRRPVLAAEKTQYLGTYNNFSGTAQEKMKTALAAILTSPQFLYRELSNPTGGAASYVNLNSYELASRLSYFVWETMPDAELFAKAQSGELNQPAVLSAQLKRLIQSSRVEALARSIAEQWFGYGSIWQHSLNTTTFPNFNTAMKQSMYNESVQFIKYLLQADRPVSDLINASYSFVDANVGGLYGMSIAANAPMSMVSLASTQRQGILGHAGILALTSSGEKTSIVRRGLWVNEKLLCTVFGAPPPGVDTSLPTTLPPDATAREIMELHRSRAQCASCHNYIDPPGMVMEKFDPMGRYRTQYTTGRSIDSSAKLANGFSLLEPADLNAYLAKDKNFSMCVTKHLMPLAAGRQAKYEDQCAVQNVTQGKIPTDITFGTLVDNMVKSMIFTMQAGE